MWSVRKDFAEPANDINSDEGLISLQCGNLPPSGFVAGWDRS